MFQVFALAFRVQVEYTELPGERQREGWLPPTDHINLPQGGARPKKAGLKPSPAASRPQQFLLTQAVPSAVVDAESHRTTPAPSFGQCASDSVPAVEPQAVTHRDWPVLKPHERTSASFKVFFLPSLSPHRMED